MQQIDFSGPRLDVIRFLNFLARHGIRAEMCEVSGDPSGREGGAPDGMETLWVEDEDHAAAELLREEFLSESRLLKEESSSDDSQPTELEVFYPRKIGGRILVCLVVLPGLFTLALVAFALLHWGPGWLRDWHLSRAERARSEGRIQESIDAYSRAIALDPLDPGPYIQRGFQFRLDGRFDEALADFERALENDPKVHDAQACRAEILMLRSDLNAAFDLASQDVLREGPSAFACNIRANVALGLADWQRASRDFETAMVLEPHGGTYWNGRAAVRYELSDYEGACSDADHAVWLNDRDGIAQFLRGLSGMRLASNNEKRARARSDLYLAVEILDAQLQSEPREVMLLCTIANVQNELFLIDNNAARLRKAIEHLDKAISIAPRYWSAYSARSEVELSRLEFAKAEQDASLALELNPRDWWSAWFRGQARLNLGRRGEALQDLTHAIEINPRFADVYLSRAQAQLELDRPREAVDDLNRAIELHGRMAAAYQLRGKIQISLGEQAAGESDLRRAEQLDSRVPTGTTAASK